MATDAEIAEKRKKIEGLIKRANNLVERFIDNDNNTPEDLLRYVEFIMATAALNLADCLPPDLANPKTVLYGMYKEACEIYDHRDDGEEDN